MLNRISPKEKAHLSEVKRLPCSVCDAPPPSDAHHIKQGLQYTCVALCKDCHQGPCGLHGNRTLWKVYKREELDVLAETIAKLTA